MPFASSSYLHCTDELAGMVGSVQGKCRVTSENLVGDDEGHVKIGDKARV